MIMHTFYTLILYDSLLSHHTAAEPPCKIDIEENHTAVFVSWTEPVTGATPTLYKIFFERSGGVMDNQYAQNNSTRYVTAPIIVNSKSSETIYNITVFTLSAMLPSRPSLTFKSKAQTTCVFSVLT